MSKDFVEKDFLEIERMQKRRAKKKLMKKISFIFIVCVISLGVYLCYQNNYYIKLIKNIDIVYKTFKKAGGYPVNINATDIKDKARLGTELLILDEDIIYIFNRYGYRTLYQKHGLSNPRVVSNNKDLAVVFERLGKKLKIYSKIEELSQKEFDEEIYNVNVTSDGKIVVIKGSNRAMSSLEVLGNNHKSVFKWDCSDKYIGLCDFAPNNKNFAVVSLKVENVEYFSVINLFNINQEKKLAELVLKDEIIVSMKHKGDYLYIIGEKNVYLLDKNLKIKKQYDYKEKTLKAFENNLDKNIVLIFDNYNQSLNNNVVLLSENLDELVENQFSGKIKDISADNKNFYILTDEEIVKFDLDFKNIKKYDISSITTDIIALDSKLYYFNSAKLQVLR